jgi:hypothetical protein
MRERIAQTLSTWSNSARAWVAARMARPKAEAAPDKPAPRQSLVKSRPQSLEQRYELLDHDELADEIFLRLKARIFDATPQAGYLREAGRIAPGRPYFYLKPLGAKGFLFERSGKGWVVTPAEKIVGRDLFLRDPEPLDVVSLFLAKDRVAFPRVKSARGGDALLAFSVYEQRLLNQIGVAP